LEIVIALLLGLPLGPAAIPFVKQGGLQWRDTLYVFRSKRSDKMKMVWWYGSGICLFAKMLEETQFCWPKIASTRVRLNHAQLLACTH
ncbi:transposase, partial [Bradyrhizobium sp. RT9b]|uniref:IS66 family insertion sequence element accessory protein TnpB n=1 Tax=Bradyrhizobium sp. RT9b TaxID=3156385 RepID=UPI003394E488